ncbi:hypothetical protein Y032_0076g998 [Ancylostoma ceylanicum]|uniref:G-protein coupled receptors family 1 profile domain-containing protein n=1 Tax=Ancylostoma ceylanicum TaxID=53326 RepID=A0A016TUZ5_9BILA|nr:hypothetical protein Y032_0076g998 [Ancylostoma ceylanicum]
MNETCQDCGDKMEYVLAGVIMLLVESDLSCICCQKFMHLHQRQTRSASSDAKLIAGIREWSSNSCCKTTSLTQLGVIGCTINTIAIILLFKTSVFHRSFGYICASHLIADTGVLAIHIFWAGPASLLRLELDVTSSFIGSTIGQIALFFWFATLYSQVQIAINRLIAIAWPTTYTMLFTGKGLAIFISMFWIVSGLQSFLHFWDECKYYFDVTVFSWIYPDTRCGRFASFYLDFLPSTTACTLVFLIHTATFFCILLRTSAIFSTEQLLLLKRNIRFYVQGLVTAVTLASIIVCFHLISRFAITRWEKFASSTLVWLIAHIMDGVIIIVFNKPFRAMFWHPCSVRRTKNTTTMALNSALKQ